MTPAAVLLDLDGTLSDSAPGLLASLRHMHAGLGWDVPDDDALRRWLGPPTSTTLAERGCDAATIDRGMRLFRERLIDGGGLWEQDVYPGIPALLADLATAGVPTSILTFKLQEDAEAVAEHLGLRGSLGAVHGRIASDDGRSKAPLIARALAELGVPASGDVVMVGDRRHDVEGAIEAGVEAVAVTWGYGSRAELEASGARHVVDDVDELRRLLLP
ncbi:MULTISPECIES: HAD hydrolase-like protein [unclassified Agrococcus]|uniref:HAD hydrolase-like protein n=1 Tax=unclassified Agrococcus TaxID=2615065 RepID=UPI003616834E